MRAEPRHSRRPALRIARGLAASLVAAFVALGLHLRFSDVTAQFLGDDELHAVHVATIRSYAGILRHYTPHDHGVTLSLYAKLLMDADALSETAFRLPVMLSATLLLLAPLHFRRRIGSTATLVALALFATSPPMVFYSIFARPYAPAALCLLLALDCWTRWMHERGGRAWLAFALLSAAAIVLHLFSVFPIAALFGLSLARSRTHRHLRRTLPAALVTAAVPVLVVLAPGAPDLLATRGAMIGGTTLSAKALALSHAQLVGTLPLVGTLLLAACVGGVAVLFRRDAVLASGMAALLAAQALAVIALRPTGDATAWARYYSLVWPVWLLAAAVGLDACGRLASRHLPGDTYGSWRTALHSGVSLALGLGLALAVPLASPMALYRAHPSNFRSGKGILQPGRLPEELPPAVRALLAEEERGEILLQYPYLSKNTRWLELAAYQESHHMQIRMADEHVERLRARGIHHRNVIDLLDPQEIEASGARFLLFEIGRDSAHARELVRDRYGSPLASDGRLELYALGGRGRRGAAIRRSGADADP